MDRTGGFYPSHAGSNPARITFKSFNGTLAKWPCAWPQTMRRGFESRTYLQFTPAKPDSFRAASQGLYATSLSESLARKNFTVRTKEPTAVFPRRARLGPSCDITDFASAPVGVARRIQVYRIYSSALCHMAWQRAVTPLHLCIAGSIPALPTILSRLL